MIYNKLVRDKIPEIIAQKGGTCEYRILTHEEYGHYLEQKLDEEVEEFHRDRNVEELADILEVVYSLAASIGCTQEELLETCLKKRVERGGFSHKIFLISSER